jgi:hypothetical protein
MAERNNNKNNSPEYYNGGYQPIKDARAGGYQPKGNEQSSLPAAPKGGSGESKSKS